MNQAYSFTLAGTGSYLPRRGRVADPDETTSMMAAAAALGAIESAGWRADEVNLLVGASSVMEQPIPGTALLVQRRLGLGRSGIAAFDVNATCLSALVALDLVLAGFAVGRWRRALIVSAERPQSALDPEDEHARAMFGDGAAALAVEAGGPSRLLASRTESYGEHADLCRLEAGGTRLDPHVDLAAFMAGARFRMAGPALFRATARLFPPFLDRLLGEAELPREAIDLVVPHQASRAALDHLVRVLGGPASRVIDQFDRHGNQVAASLLHALHRARVDGRLRSGETALLVGSAAGITLGGMVVRW